MTGLFTLAIQRLVSAVICSVSVIEEHPVRDSAPMISSLFIHSLFG